LSEKRERRAQGDELVAIKVPPLFSAKGRSRECHAKVETTSITKNHIQMSSYHHHKTGK
jgi:hypothetical protein